MLSAAIAAELADKLECQRICIHAQYNMMKTQASRKGCQLTYQNQQEAAQKVIQAFQEGKHLVILVAQPGAGKTGVMLEVCYQLTTHIDDDICVPVENAYILSGMSDIQWKNDMQRSMVPLFKDNIRHRGEISKIQGSISVLKNGFIANDECHLASGSTMQMATMFQSTGLVNVEYAIGNSIRVLQVSATPDAVLWDLNAWGTKAQKIKLEPGPAYKGFRVMLTEGRINRTPTFDSIESVRAFLESWQNRYNGCPTKKYFPIRLLPKSAGLMGWMKTAALQLGWKMFQYDSDERVDDIDTQMKSAPDAHTIIFIKSFWRASKRIERKHVGGCLEEPPRKRNDTSAAQGLIARFCNTYEYEGVELEHPEWRPLHYGDVAAIESYLSWFEGDCNYKTTDYSSTTLKSKGGKVKTKPSMVHHSVAIGLSEVDIDAAAAAALAEQTLFASPEHSSKEAADQWAAEHINFQHDELRNTTGKARRVDEYNSDRTKNTQRRGTHMKNRGAFIEIPTVTMVHSGQNIALQGGGGVRLLPVRMDDGDSLNQYVIVYKIQWMKPTSRAVYHPVP
jgi:hypothetical protein